MTTTSNKPHEHLPLRGTHILCRVAVIAAISFATSQLHAAEFIPLEGFIAFGVSDDGLVVAGRTFGNDPNQAIRWTELTGAVGLGFLPGDDVSGIPNDSPGISGDGTTIVGRSHGPSKVEAFIHTESGGMRGLGDFPGGDFSSLANATSFDGSVVVGGGDGPSLGTDEAFRWTASTGMQSLGHLYETCVPDCDSEAEDVSADGTIIVGRSFNGSFDQAFIWTAETGMQGLDVGHTESLGGGVTVSADGLVAGGGALVTSTTNPEAFLWTETTGAMGLGWLPGTAEDDGANHSSVTGISDNGVVIGFSGDTRERRRGFVWTEQSGMQDLQQLLIDDYGFGTTMEGWTLRAPLEISPNGRFIVGNGFNPEGENVGWLVRLDAPLLSLPGDFNGDGVVNAADYSVWRDGLSTTYTQDDYQDWKANFGSNASSASAQSPIPEPASFALLVIGLLPLFTHRRRTSTGRANSFYDHRRSIGRTDLVLVVGALAWLSANTCRADFSVTVLNESSTTYPAGTATTNFDWTTPPPKLFTESADPLAPFDDQAMVFHGYLSGGSQQRLRGAYLIYRFRVDFNEEVLLNQITVGGAGDHELGGDNATLRLLDQTRRQIAAVPLTGFNEYRVHTLDAAGVRGQTFFLDEFDYSTSWRYRDHISIDFTPILPGDFNGDGVVNSIDYTVWRDGLGTTFTQDDYQVWKVNFGSGASSASAQVTIPEPATSVMVWSALLGVTLQLRDRVQTKNCNPTRKRGRSHYPPHSSLTLRVAIAIARPANSE